VIATEPFVVRFSPRARDDGPDERNMQTART